MRDIPFSLYTPIFPNQGKKLTDDLWVWVARPFPNPEDNNDLLHFRYVVTSRKQEDREAIISVLWDRVNGVHRITVLYSRVGRKTAGHHFLNAPAAARHIGTMMGNESLVELENFLAHPNIVPGGPTY